MRYSKNSGGNDYNLPYVNKKKLEYKGKLTNSVKPPGWGVFDAWEVIHGDEPSEGEED